jgi:hypothetical protein
MAAVFPRLKLCYNAIFGGQSGPLLPNALMENTMQQFKGNTIVRW